MVKPCDNFMQVVPTTSKAMATDNRPQACDNVGVKDKSALVNGGYVTKKWMLYCLLLD